MSSFTFDHGETPVWPAIDSGPAPSPTPELSRASFPPPQAAPAPGPSPTATVLSGSTHERVQKALTLWRTRLLDLTKRNRALNFKPTKVSTVAIVDEQPVEVYRHLVLEGRPMRFRPMLPSIAKGSTSDTDNAVRNGALSVTTSTANVVIASLDGGDGVAGIDDSDEIEAPEVDFAPYDPTALEDRHRDDILQAHSTPEALDKSLRRLDEQARGTLEEQGVNILFLALGMLHYRESSDSKDVLRAPLIMVPVTLVRRSARSGFSIQATDDEPMVNPALAEHLRRSFGVALPDLPAADDSVGPAAVQAFYNTVSDIAAERVTAGMNGWSVKTDIFLGLFAFQKLVMFKDLEANADAFASHRLARQLVSRDVPAGTYLIGLPDEIRTMELDQEFPPERTAQVVDADSSQLRAIAAVSRGHDLVLEGPPGTGKSQTITNLIAQALHDGKSVLFVAEKMAALQVVHSRLMRSGLGEFCLELHASKANKRTVMQELRAALDASLQRPTVEKKTMRLPHVRRELSGYAQALHQPHGVLGISPYRAYGMLEAVLDAPRLPFRRHVDDIDQETLEETERLLDDLAVMQEPIGVPGEHPWRDTSRVFYTPAATDSLREDLAQLVELVGDVRRRADAVSRKFALPPILASADVAMAASVADVFEASPGAPLAVLHSEAWNSPPAEATELVADGRTLSEWRRQLDQKFTPEALEQDHAADSSYVEQKTSGFFGFLAILDGRFRSIKRRWTAYRVAGYSPALPDQANDMKLIDRYRKAQADIAAKRDRADALFGPLWKGERSDWAMLDRYIQWVVEVRAVCMRHGLSNDALKLATTPRPELAEVHALESAVEAMSSPLQTFRETVGWSHLVVDEAPFADLHGRLESMRSAMDGLPSWAAFEQSRQKVASGPAGELVERAMQNSGAEGDMPFRELRRSFRRAVLEKWLEQAITERAPLREFKTMQHEQRLQEFRRLDEWILHENQAAVVARLRGAAQERLQADAARAGLPFLQREMVKQRNIAPLRKLLQHAEPTVRAIKPCFLMSPLTVAQYLNGKAPSFDVVIFDEASQLPSEDAIGAICRGTQLVVVGDPKQLPPTSFFASSVGAGATTELGDDGLPIVEDSESILEEYMGAGLPVTRLKWHYRSAHESLITFSNVSFYDSDLYTFPSVETGSDTMGLSFEHVADGVYEGKGLNMAEARRVVDAVVRHAKERPHESLGVGTFNMRQQLAILDELELRRRQDPSIEPFFARSNPDPFFVKNLENIQGDERDVIFLSVTYAKGTDGKLRYNFGPINGENGWRRLNVLTTRARKRMRVFSSMHGDEINAAATTSRGAHLMREFLLFAEHGQLQSVVANSAAAAESPFEAEVISELTRRGIQVVPQVGVTGYRIDIGVQDPEVPGRFVCGIECDGVAYHSSETARDRDRLRQQVLEARGWVIHRLWSTDWFKDRQGQISRLLGLIESAKREAAVRIVAEAEAEARARELAATERREAAERESREENAQLATVAAAVAAGPYKRPTVAAYRFADGQGRHAGTDLFETPLAHVTAAVIEVVVTESPMHVDDLGTRIAGMWGLSRVGSRIAARVTEALRAAVQAGKVEQRGEFLWATPNASIFAKLAVRSRAGTRIPGDHVAPEEIAAAVSLVLKAAGGLTRDELLSEVRQVLGVGKGALAPGLTAVIGQGLRDGAWGEGSTGLALRM